MLGFFKFKNKKVKYFGIKEVLEVVTDDVIVRY